MTLEGWDRRALLGGLVFGILGILFLLEDLGVLELKAVFVLPIVLIVVGVAVLVGSLMDTGRGRRPEESRGGRI